MRTWLGDRRRRWTVGVIAVVVVAGAAFAVASTSDSHHTVAAHVVSPGVPAITGTGRAAGGTPSIDSGIAPGKAILTSMVETLDVFEAPGGAVSRRMAQLTYYNRPLTLMAIEDSSAAGATWYEVLLPARPNGQTGWVRAADVSVSSTNTLIRVYLAEHQLDLVVDGTVVMTAPVATGSPYTPTPRGTFYITDPIDLSADPTTAYGSYALGLSGYSEALDSFKGTVPQIAIHGTSLPNLVGQSVSNGCVRMENSAVTALAAQVGLGTPVIISASRTAA